MLLHNLHSAGARLMCGNGAVQTGRWMGKKKKSGWHIFVKRNVTTLRLREVALNALPAGLKFEDVCDASATEPSLKSFGDCFFEFQLLTYINFQTRPLFMLELNCLPGCQNICPSDTKWKKS